MSRTVVSDIQWCVAVARFAEAITLKRAEKASGRSATAGTFLYTLSETIGAGADILQAVAATEETGELPVPPAAE